MHLSGLLKHDFLQITGDSDTTLKVKRTKFKVTRPLWLVVLAGQRGHTVMVTYPYAYMTYILSPLAGLGGAYRGGRPPTACSVREPTLHSLTSSKSVRNFSNHSAIALYTHVIVYNLLCRRR